MGSAHDIMQTFAGRDLHAQFPEREGWEWNVLPAEKTGLAMYRVFRGDIHRYQEAVLAVSFECKPSEESVAALIAAPDGNRVRRYLLVPQGADVSCVPSGIHILTMASYGFTGGKLTWLTNKKNAMRYHLKDCTPASATVKQE
jgi:hypothetical protein